MAQGPAKSAHRSISSIDELRTFAADAGFPEHRLMLRPDDEHSLEIIKGLADWPTLEHSFFEMLEKSTTGRVFAENDLRAFCNPTRQAMISNAAQDLLNKLLSICPHCSSPGYSIAHRKAGLPCGTCNAPTAFRSPTSGAAQNAPILRTSSAVHHPTPIRQIATTAILKGSLDMRNG
jgi:hypothetical protein